MSDTISLAYVDCQVSLWVGQGGYRAPTKAYLYSTDDARKKFTEFYDAHRGHDIRLVHAAGLETLDPLGEWSDMDEED